MDVITRQIAIKTVDYSVSSLKLAIIVLIKVIFLVNLVVNEKNGTCCVIMAVWSTACVQCVV